MLCAVVLVVAKDMDVPSGSSLFGIADMADEQDESCTVTTIWAASLLDGPGGCRLKDGAGLRAHNCKEVNAACVCR
jgi:hypothetical protein